VKMTGTLKKELQQKAKELGKRNIEELLIIPFTTQRLFQQQERLIKMIEW